MNFLKFNNRRGQESINSILRWALYIAIAVTAIFVFRAIIVGASG